MQNEKIARWAESSCQDRPLGLIIPYSAPKPGSIRALEGIMARAGGSGTSTALNSSNPIPDPLSPRAQARRIRQNDLDQWQAG